MIPGYQNNNSLCEPFIQALEHSQDCLYGMLLNGKYMYAVMCRSGLREWANYAKWVTEAIFEYVRKMNIRNVSAEEDIAKKDITEMLKKQG